LAAIRPMPTSGMSPRMNTRRSSGLTGPAWRLWRLLAEQQEGARRAGRWVTASKLLAAKRPRLIPIFDQTESRDKLCIEHHDIWEVMWCVL
jgi:hypothetical protein